MAQLDEISRRQRGVVTRQQALRAGITPDVLRRRVTSGRWQRLLPGTYATFAGRPPPDVLRWAAVLHAGAGAMLCLRSAAEEAGLAEPRPGAVHVLIPEERRVRQVPGLVVHRSRHASARRHPHRRPPQTRMEETVLDLVVTAPDAAEAMHWITTACARRLTTPDRIAQALARRSRLARRYAVSALLAVAATGHTTPLPHWPAA
ncbi:type IV toxin-antitoxin system AbiEi family antitoxin domain-containing protein [Actinoplanes teichomyceticus]|uniref:Putative AbiEi antitoxin of type IV toxin-antitoxin system n=1 Tax=Actinoplanes teichomyceticus TaxID=1867 RepID=A0A561WNR8_ACTTI|nr:type IV toxin-antitoxin system AbiEi family antitoxin domain-containing protein [Actinoplanes teichomyceticus]TWG25511.1 putative AbiEi antitoxin of type IV toxin-antitoxin system [Actinoplanes teichomyceticus]GIF10581.1 hypothetical protein Ate01nite_06130 [Actinoplanes teichomyceticus]